MGAPGHACWLSGARHRGLTPLSGSRSGERSISAPCQEQGCMEAGCFKPVAKHLALGVIISLRRVLLFAFAVQPASQCVGTIFSFYLQKVVYLDV